MTCRTFVLTALFLLPLPLGAQTATSCVDQAWQAFRAEVEGKENPMDETGNAYLAAYGWIRATQTCLDATSYPPEKAEAAENFRNSVALTSEEIEIAILNDEVPSIFALAHGGDGRVFFMYPEEAPQAGTTGDLTDQLQADPAGQQTGTGGYRMLSMREMSRIQARLTRLGFDTGGADGIAGPRTFRAIARYQRSQGREPTGLLSSREIERLLN